MKKSTKWSSVVGLVVMLTMFSVAPASAAGTHYFGARTCTLPRVATTYGTGAGTVFHFHLIGGYEYGQLVSNQVVPIYKTWTQGAASISGARITYTISLSGSGTTCEQ